MQFPADFLWGAATAAFQIEGATAADGRGASNWDEFCAVPGNVVGGASGDPACDHYYRWEEDIELMRRLGLRAYRLSIAWPRVMPAGRGPVNAKGLDFYDRLIDGLCSAGIEPMVTLFHWDLPAALQHDLGGWAGADLPNIFAEYARVVFDRLGDRVKLWLTLNEPWVVVDAGYFHGVHPPGLKDRRLGYLAGHNLLRGHAYAVAAYRGSRHNSGQISFALNSSFSIPATRRIEDLEASQRGVETFAGWFGDPPVRGDYPEVMRHALGALLPEFTEQDRALLRGSVDYLALNYYTSEVVRASPGNAPFQFEVVPQPETPRTEMNWPIRADGFESLLLWLHERYGGLPLYVTENGAAMADEADASGFVDDPSRIAYLRDHLQACRNAMNAGLDLRGYFVWSLLDNLEWSQGYEKRFGIVRCDPQTQRRTIKASGHWYARLIAEQLRGNLVDETTAAAGDCI